MHGRYARLYILNQMVRQMTYDKLGIIIEPDGHGRFAVKLVGVKSGKLQTIEVLFKDIGWVTGMSRMRVAVDTLSHKFARNLVGLNSKARNEDESV